MAQDKHDGVLIESEPVRVWYHGSPYRLAVLRAGSTVTPDPQLARVFSHKPTLVSIEDDGTIRHDGSAPGYLYRVAEVVTGADLCPHPCSTMGKGMEWLTTRDLALELVGPTEILETERLTAREMAELRQRIRSASSPPSEG
jgi:hypothetical protein